MPPRPTTPSILWPATMALAVSSVIGPVKVVTRAATQRLLPVREQTASMTQDGPRRNDRAVGGLLGPLRQADALRHDSGVLFADLAAVSAAVAESRSRKRKAELLGDALRRLEWDEIEAGVAYLSGELRQRRTGVGWAGLREVPPPAGQPVLQVSDVDAALARVAALSGSGSHGERRAAIADLFAR